MKQTVASVAGPDLELPRKVLIGRTGDTVG